jgi:hypothetical protein
MKSKTMKNFPKINHADKVISCFNCYQDLYEFHAIETDNPKGQGKFYTCCESCSMKTFFDFTEDNHAKNTN